jgi:hypothetical protein
VAPRAKARPYQSCCVVGSDEFFCWKGGNMTEQITERKENKRPFCKALILVLYGLLIKIGRGMADHFKNPPCGYVGPFTH